jgi:Rrf2 family transcriptional regulator, nitric oxide-sensitive transcriptional repressor
MRLTRFTDYSLRTLIYLGLHDDTLVSIADVARAYRVKENHLTKVVARLAQLGLVETVRGRKGGLRLARLPAQIRIGEVVRATEDNLAIVECFASTACRLTGACQLELVLHGALDAFLAVLDRYTLDDLVFGPPNLPARIGLSDRLRTDARYRRPGT